MAEDRALKKTLIEKRVTGEKKLVERKGRIPTMGYRDFLRRSLILEKWIEGEGVQS